MTATILTICESDLIDAIHKVEVIADQTTHWSAVRIDPDGTIRVSEEVSRCYSEDEYYRKRPHTVTVYSRTGHGQCNMITEELASPTQDMVDAIRKCDVPAVESELEEAGYEVEWK